MNEYRRGLLGNKPHSQEINEEWIMLQDLNLSKTPKGSNHYDQNRSKKDYQRLNDNLQRPAVHQDHPYRDPRKIQQIPRDTPFNPKVITINGQTFQEIDKNQPVPQPRPKKSKLPAMHVGCYYCSLVQSVPGTSQRFVCCSCNKDNSCTPAFRIFMCGTCSSKVCYAVGTSELIKCTKCSTINKVPAVKSPYEVEFNIPSSLDNYERATEPLEEISQGGLTELRHDDEELREYFGKRNREY